MKMNRFFAPTMREAIAQVRAEQGPDAVILSNKRVEGGVEIVTAIDYDESLVQQALASPARSATPEAPAAAAETPGPGADVERAPADDAAMPPPKVGFFGTLRDAMRGKSGPASPAPVSAVADKPEATAERTVRARPAPSAVQPQTDPAMSRMQHQVESMRQLLESQLSSLAWNDLTRRNPPRARVLNDLIALDIPPDIAR